jgi:hypothetical protein
MGKADNAPFKGDLYHQVRAGLVAQGTSLNRWCRQNGVTRQYATRCLRFERNGKGAEALRHRLIKAAKASHAYEHAA